MKNHFRNGAFVFVLLCGGMAVHAQGPILGDAVTASTLPGLLPPRAPTPQATTGPNWYIITSRQTVQNSWNNVFAPTASAVMGWTGSVVPDNPGTTNQSYKDAVATRINWVRAMAGVPGPITLDPTLSAKDQQAALMMSANMQLSHFPPSNWLDYTADGATAAAKSNICAGFGATTDVGCVLGYVIDNGSNNTTAGHRASFLYPQTQTMGTGDVSQSGPADNPYYYANATWVQDPNNIFATRPATRDTYVAWPPPGYVPYEVVGPRWSFMYPDADFSGASVSMTSNGAAVPVRMETLPANNCLPPFVCQPENSIVWVPNNQDTSSGLFTPVAPASDTTYMVSITNVKINGTPQTFNYSVTVFDPSTGGTPSGPPAPASLTPSVSTGASQFLTATFNAPAGYQTLNVVNVLINNFLDGRQACYLAYSVASNALYIVGDIGDPTQITGKVMNGSGTVGNSQCTVNLVGSSAIGSGTTLTLTLNLSFATSFGGNKVIYTAAGDTSGNNSGWSTMGVHGVPPLPSTFPNPVGMSPSSGSTLNQTITFTYQDQTTASNLQTVWALFNTALDGRAACYIAYYRPGNQVYLDPDNGDGNAATSIPLTGNNTISNSQCTVSAQGSQVQSSGNTLTVTLPITFKPSFAGFKGVWMAAQTLNAVATSPWQSLGAEVIPAH